MLQYTARRLISAIPVLLGILVVTFLLARLIPGDPCRAMLGEKATESACERFNEANGLNDPIWKQFVIYMGNMLQGNFGESIRFSRPVSLIMIERLPLTIELGFFALTLAIIVGVPLGVISAVRSNTSVDVATMIGANIGVSMPVYWLGLMLAYVFALLLKDTPLWLPPSGRLTAGLVAIPFYDVYHLNVAPGTTAHNVVEFISNFYILNSLITFNWEVLVDASRHLILPAVALSTIPMAIIARMSRSSMLEVLRQDYVRTARAKGLWERTVIIKHAFRNSLLPIVTIIGLQLGIIFSGAVLTESIFGLAGVGRMLFEAITARDYPIVQGFTLVIAVGYVLMNLVTDISYIYIDPRIKLE